MILRAGYSSSRIPLPLSVALLVITDIVSSLICICNDSDIVVVAAALGDAGDVAGDVTDVAAVDAV